MALTTYKEFTELAIGLAQFAHWEVFRVINFMLYELCMCLWMAFST